MQVQGLRLDPKRPARELLALWRQAGLPTGRGRYKRVYQALWERARKEASPAYRRKRAAQQARYRTRPEIRERRRNHRRAWGARNRRRIARYNREYRGALGGARECFGCHRRQGLRRIERVVVERDGALVPRKMLWCGRC